MLMVVQCGELKMKIFQLISIRNHMKKKTNQFNTNHPNDDDKSIKINPLSASFTLRCYMKLNICE